MVVLFFCVFRIMFLSPLLLRFSTAPWLRVLKMLFTSLAIPGTRFKLMSLMVLSLHYLTFLFNFSVLFVLIIDLFWE